MKKPFRIAATSAVIESETMNQKEACKFLRLCPRGINNAIREQGLPCRIVGRRQLFTRAALVAWLNGSSPANDG